MWRRLLVCVLIAALPVAAAAEGVTANPQTQSTALQPTGNAQTAPSVDTQTSAVSQQQLADIQGDADPTSAAPSHAFDVAVGLLGVVTLGGLGYVRWRRRSQ